MIETVKSGLWQDSGIWDAGRVPALGDDVHIRHFVYSEQPVIVGSGSSDALLLSHLLLCRKMLSVLGGVRSVTPAGGLFLISDEPNWIFYSSEGIQLYPLPEDVLREAWESVFGGAPEGYILPIAGDIDTECYISPQTHAVLTPLLDTLRRRPSIYSAHHDVENPSGGIRIYACLHEGLTELADILSRLDAMASAAATLGVPLEMKLEPIGDLALSILTLLEKSAPDAVAFISEEEGKLVILVKRKPSVNETVSTISTVLGIASSIAPLLQKVGLKVVLEVKPI